MDLTQLKNKLVARGYSAKKQECILAKLENGGVERILQDLSVNHNKIRAVLQRQQLIFFTCVKPPSEILSFIQVLPVSSIGGNELDAFLFVIS